MPSRSSVHGISGLMDGLAAADRYIGNRKNEQMREKQMGLQEAAYARDEERHNSQMEMQEIAKQEAFGQLAARYAQILEGMDVGEPSPEQSELIKKHPTFDPQFVNSPEVDKAMQTYEAVKGGQLSLSSPEVAEAINAVSPEVNLGANDGRARKVVRVIPGQEPGTLMFGLQVEGDPRERPLTQRRSSEPNDPVMQVKAEDLIGKFEGLKQYRSMLNSKKGRQALIQAYSPAAKKGDATYGPIVTDKNTGMQGQFDSLGRFHPIDKRKSDKTSSRGGGNMPNDAKMIEYLQRKYKDEGKNLTTEQAHAMIKLAASDPSRFVSSMVATRNKDNAFVNNYLRSMKAYYEENDIPNNKQKSRQELEKEAFNILIEDTRKLYKELRSSYLPDAGGADSGEMTPAPEGAVKMLRDDPSLAPQFKAKYGYLPEGYE